MRIKKDFQSSFIKGAGFSAGASIFVALSVALAQSLTSFNSGDLVSASSINANFQIAAPEGAIVAFYLAACPTGWVATDGTNSTPDLRGYFVRARDPGNATGRDPDGDRTIGNTQTDAFQGHRHNYSPNGWKLSEAGGIQENPGAGLNQHGTLTILDPITDGTNGTPRTANETRPENVALTYCMRKDT